MAWREERIGDCRLILGDCMGVMPKLGRVDAVVTDPPYGMAFKSNHRTTKHRAIANDESTDLLKWACELKMPHSVYAWMRWDNVSEIPKPRSLITWVKNNWSMGDLEHEHGRQTEVCAFYPGPNHSWGNGRPSDVVNYPRTGNEHHPTEKPVGLMQAVVGWTKGVVCDPFMGSGTTLIACAKMGRAGIGIELDSEYFDIACRRVEDAYRQPDMFIAPTVQPKQEALF